jgi:hypothetical protein
MTKSQGLGDVRAMIQMLGCMSESQNLKQWHPSYTSLQEKKDSWCKETSARSQTKYFYPAWTSTQPENIIQKALAKQQSVSHISTTIQNALKPLENTKHQAIVRNPC